MRYKHGRRYTPEYTVWHSMKDRCYRRGNRRYNDYGGRGITVCERWLNSFQAFFEDMSERPSPEHSLERRDNDSHYCPENCYWATRIEQCANRRPRRVRPRTSSPLRYLLEVGSGYQLRIQLRRGYRYSHTFKTLDEALEARADCEMEREMFYLLGGI